LTRPKFSRIHSPAEPTIQIESCPVFVRNQIQIQCTRTKADSSVQLRIFSSIAATCCITAISRLLRIARRCPNLILMSEGDGLLPWRLLVNRPTTAFGTRRLHRRPRPRIPNTCECQVSCIKHKMIDVRLRRSSIDVAVACEREGRGAIVARGLQPLIFCIAQKLVYTLYSPVAQSLPHTCARS
jgi:hypothetical protein